MTIHHEERTPFLISVRELLREVSDRSSSSGISTTSLAENGLRFLCDGPKSRKTLTFIDGLACTASAHNRLLNNIRAGQLVMPLPAEFHGTPILPINAVTPTTVRTFRGTLLGLLAGGTKDLISALLAAPYRRCAGCGQRIPRYTRIDRIIEDIVYHFSDEEITVTLHGHEEDVRRFSVRHGLSLEHLEEKAVVYLDSLRVTNSAIRRLERVLSISLANSTTHWIAVSSSKGTRGYCRDGYCNNCRAPGRNIDHLEVRVIIEEGPATTSSGDCSNAQPCVTKLLELGTITLAEAFNLSLKEAALCLHTPLPLASAASEAGFGALSLSELFENLSAQARLALATIISLENHLDVPISIIDLPIVMEGFDWSLPFKKKLENYATTHSVVITAPECSTPKRHTTASESRTHPAPTHLAPSHLTLPRELDSLRFGQHPLDGTSPIAVLSAVEGSHAVDLFTILSQAASDEPRIETLALLKMHTMSRSVVIEELDLYDRLTRLFAASIQAKSLGLTPSSFKRTASRAKHSLLCPTCRGLGLVLHDAEVGDRPSAAICTTCKGTRFAPPLSGITFKGRTLPALLDSTIKENLALLRTLPRAAKTLDLLDRVGLTHLPLGMPLALLSFSESRLLRFVTAITATRRIGDIVCIEEPFAGLSIKQRQDLEGVFSEIVQWTNASFILIGNDPGLSSLGPTTSIKSKTRPIASMIELSGRTC